MMKHLVPYQKIGIGAALLVIILVVWMYQFRSDLPPQWMLWLAGILSGLAYLSGLMEAVVLFREYRQGNLFPMRNATFFLATFTLVAYPIVLVCQQFGPQMLHPGNLLLVPVLLLFLIRGLFRVRLDSVQLEAKTGFRPPYRVPLFRIASVDASERRIVVTSDEGKEVHLLRPFFFAAHWEVLRERLEGLSN
jgi:hypothetical protein